MPARHLTPREKLNLRIVAQSAGDYALVFPTRTALRKSICDATQPLRTLFADHNFHRYDEQGRGMRRHGVVSQATFISDTREESVHVSLYRPKTKAHRGGDPRFWPSQFHQHVRPNDAVALFFKGESLCMMNLTCSRLHEAVSSERQTYATDFFETARQIFLAPVQELVDELRRLTLNGPLRTAARDEGVGYAVETALGIRRNAQRTPDYRGKIEIKSGRCGSRSKATLFTCVPDWELCRELNRKRTPAERFCASHWEILNRYGYHDGLRWALYCTVRTERANPQGLMLALDQEKRRLVETSRSKPANVAVWRLDALHQSLRTKHPRTLWVNAKAERHGADELFFLKKATYTQGPSLYQFDALLLDGAITVDHRIHLGADSRDDHGIPFRIKPNRVHDLFEADPVHYDLAP